MAELAYPVGHPAHPDFDKKNLRETRTGFEYDYPPNHPARGGQGQPVPYTGVEGEPHAGFKHLHGLPGATLVERQREFLRLPLEEQKARLEWNENGIPAQPEEE